ncbi:MAG: T9SS type A sorting domain-containing protein, partial [Ignavibacteria bacterium]|nr:T9SS type A sorting domain-containing protein [Ignavibacteria bacterium]
LMVKFSPQGNLLWDYNNQNFIFKNISSDLFNNIYTGANVYSGNERGPGVIKFNKHGDVIWSRFHHMGEYVENISDMQVKNPFSIYISYLGSKGGLPSYSGFTKFNSNGLEKWSYKNFRNVFDTTIGTGSLIMAFTDYRTMFSAATGIGNPRKNDFHTAKNTEEYFSISGIVTFKDNNQPVQGGFVKAIYYDETSSGMVTVDSAAIQSNGNYMLTKIPTDTIDLMFYQDDDLLHFVPTYYVSTIDWREATPIYATQNLSNINCQVYRINNTANPFTISGQVTANLDNPSVSAMKDAIVYAKSGGSFRNYGVSNGNGSYITTKLPAGSYELITHRMGFAPVSQNVTIINSSLSNINFDMGSPLIGINIINENIPTKYLLSQNYPNPFNPATTIKFAVPVAGLIKLSVYDILGREIEILANENLSAGTYSVNWNASNYPSGIYFYRLEGNEFTETKKMVLIK